MQQLPVQQTTPIQQTIPVQQTTPVKQTPPVQKPVQKKKPVQKGHHSSYAQNLPGRVAGFTALREVIQAMPGSGFGSQVVGNTAGIMASDAVRHGVDKITHHHHHA